MDEAFKRWPDEMWAAKGKPRLWVKLYDRDGVQVWRDIAYGYLKLKTPEGIQEGKDEVWANGIRAVFRRGTLEIFFKRPESEPSQETKKFWEKDTVGLEMKKEPSFPPR